MCPGFAQIGRVGSASFRVLQFCRSGDEIVCRLIASFGWVAYAWYVVVPSAAVTGRMNGSGKSPA